MACSSGEIATTPRSPRIIPHRAHIIPYCLWSSRLLIRPGLLSKSSFPSGWRYVKQDNFPPSQDRGTLFEIKRHTRRVTGIFFLLEGFIYRGWTSSTGRLHNEATDRVIPDCLARRRWILIHDEIDTSVSRGSRLFLSRQFWRISCVVQFGWVWGSLIICFRLKTKFLKKKISALTLEQPTRRADTFDP